MAFRVVTLNLKNTLRATILAGLLTTLVGCVNNQSKPSKVIYAGIKSEIQTVFDGLIEAAKSLDVNAYLHFFDKNNFTSLNADGSVYHSLTDFENNYREQVGFIKKYELLDFEHVKINVINETSAILVNEYLAEVILKSGDTVSASGAGTQVWSKSSGHWKLVHVSSSAK